MFCLKPVIFLLLNLLMCAKEVTCATPLCPEKQCSCRSVSKPVTLRYSKAPCQQVLPKPRNTAKPADPLPINSTMLCTTSLPLLAFQFPPFHFYLAWRSTTRAAPPHAAVSLLQALCLCSWSWPSNNLHLSFPQGNTSFTSKDSSLFVKQMQLL